jgi:hypothetical protein
VARHDRRGICASLRRDALARLRAHSPRCRHGRSDSPSAPILPLPPGFQERERDHLTAADQSAVSRKPRLQAARAYSSKSAPVGGGNCGPALMPATAESSGVGLAPGFAGWAGG